MYSLVTGRGNTIHGSRKGCLLCKDVVLTRYRVLRSHRQHVIARQEADQSGVYPFHQNHTSVHVTDAEQSQATFWL
jgi:hypothetical protein